MLKITKLKPKTPTEVSAPYFQNPAQRLPLQSPHLRVSLHHCHSSALRPPKIPLHFSFLLTKFQLYPPPPLFCVLCAFLRLKLLDPENHETHESPRKQKRRLKSALHPSQSHRNSALRPPKLSSASSSALSPPPRFASPFPPKLRPPKLPLPNFSFLLSKFQLYPCPLPLQPPSRLQAKKWPSLRDSMRPPAKSSRRAFVAVIQTGLKSA